MRNTLQGRHYPSVPLRRKRVSNRVYAVEQNELETEVLRDYTCIILKAQGIDYELSYLNLLFVFQLFLPFQAFEEVELIKCHFVVNIG